VGAIFDVGAGYGILNRHRSHACNQCYREHAAHDPAGGAQREALALRLVMSALGPKQEVVVRQVRGDATPRSHCGGPPPA
jgi:hypothetical protein